MSAKKKLTLAGVFPPIPTPFRTDGDVDLSKLASNLDRWGREPLSGYVVGGSNGEFVFLSSEERVAVVKAARQAIPHDRLLIAGSGMESTRETLVMTERMAEAGADAAIVVTPCYYTSQMDGPALENHYLTLAEASPLPLILYSVPANTGIDLPLETVIHLARHERIIGIKDSSGNLTKIGLMIHQTPDDFQVLAGSAGFVLGALALGAVGMVAALANIASAELAMLLSCVHDGDFAQAREIQLGLLKVNSAVTSIYGVAGLKTAMDLLGYYGGPVRAPLLALGESQKEDLRNILEQAGLL